MNLPPAFVPDETVLNGVGASTGIAIGIARVFSHKNLHLPTYQLAEPALIESEFARMERAKDVVRQKLTASKNSLPVELSGQAGIIDAHLLLLDDPMLVKKTYAIIRNEMVNAEQAIVRSLESISALLESVADEYISSRLSDVEMVGYSLITALMGDGAPEMPDAPEGSILVAADISPAEVTKIAASKIAGLVTESGGHTSHTAIVAQAMQLPAVVGAKRAVANINTGDTVIIDGSTGHVIIRPDQDTLIFYRARQKMEQSFNAEIVRCSHLPAVTLDDKRIEVMGNLELVEELPAIITCGCEGIGLYRTEFMYLNRKVAPTEDELFETYRRVVESAAPRQVTIRTLDLGYDKVLERNPLATDSDQALGLRGIRFCLRNQGIFEIQLRAILRASAFGDIRIMLPMISSLEELRRTQALISKVENSLERDGIPYAPRIPLGIMVEVPATVFLAKELAGEASFFSIGTNDLIQYTLAVDRGDPNVADLYQPLHPAILRMLKHILDVGRETHTPVSICGDMAAGEVTAPILVGLGAEILSMPPGTVPKIKRILRMSSYAELKSWADDVLLCKTALEATGKATGYVRRRHPELFR